MVIPSQSRVAQNLGLDDSETLVLAILLLLLEGKCDFILDGDALPVWPVSTDSEESLLALVRNTTTYFLCSTP